MLGGGTASNRRRVERGPVRAVLFRLVPNVNIPWDSTSNRHSVVGNRNTEVSDVEEPILASIPVPRTFFITGYAHTRRSNGAGSLCLLERRTGSEESRAKETA